MQPLIAEKPTRSAYGAEVSATPAWALNAALEHYRRETPELALVIFRRQGGSPILYVSGPPDEVHQNLVWAKGFLEDAADLVDRIGIEGEDFDDLED